MFFIKKYISHAAKYYPLMTFILILSFIISLCGLVKTYFFSAIIDNVIGQNGLSVLIHILIIFILLLLVEISLSYVIGYLNTYITQNISISLRSEILKRIEIMHLKILYAKKSSDIIVRVTDDVNIISNCLCNYSLTLASSLLTAIITVIFIFYLNPILAIITLVVVVAQVVISVLLSKISVKNQREQLIFNEDHISFLKNIFGLIKYIRSYQMENILNKRYDGFQNRLYKLNMKSFIINYVYGSLTTVLSFLGSMTIFVVGIILVNNNVISIGILFVFDSISDILYRSIGAIANIVLAYTKATVSFDRLNEFIDSESECDEGALELDKNIETIEYKNVKFGYDNIEVLNNFSCRFAAGNSYAIVGRSGIGKSTLLNLLLRFYSLQEGSILVNGIDIKEVSLSGLRQDIAVTFQEGCIVEGTIRENICLQNNADEKTFNEVVSLCGIREIIENLPNGYETLIMENGTNLSGGQKQRICVARALLKSSDIYVFDEAFSQMDATLEYSIVSRLKKRLKNKILIFITHNINVAKDADSILVFDDDNIFCGDNDTLLNTSKLYSEFVMRGWCDEE